MAISISFNGVVYSVPETGDESWGESLTSYFVAIPQGALQKTGGSFTLTGEVNFGATYGLLAAYFKTRASNPSSAGLLRLSISDTIGWRNNANSADLLLAVNGSDQLTFDGTAIYPNGITSLTGDVTGTGPGATATTIAAIQGNTVSGTTGTGNVVFSTSPTLVTPALGTPSSGVLTNCTGLPIATGVSGLGTGIATFLATPSSANLAAAITDETGSGALVFATSPTLVTPNIGAATGTSLNLSGLSASSAVATDGSKNLVSVTNTGTGNNVLATSPTLVTPNLGTPSSVVLTNATGLPISTGVSGLGAGVATFLATPSSANLAAAVTDETGSGALVFATSPTLVTPNIGAATGTSLNLSGLTASQAVVTDGSKNLTSLAYTAAPTASTLMSRDSSANVRSNNLISNYASTATAGGTTTLTVGSARIQVFTGASNQNCDLPDATTLPQTGFQFFIINTSSGTVTVRDNGGNTVQAMAANSFLTVTNTSIASSNGSWQSSYSVNNAGGGTVSSVAMSVPSFLSVAGSPVTTTGTLAVTLATQTARTFFQGPSSGSAAAPTFAALTAPLRTTFTATGTQTGWLFTISTSSTVAVGDTYTNNGNTYTVLGALTAQSGQVLFMSGTGATSGGTLTRATGSGTSSITFSTKVALATYTPATSPPPLAIRVKLWGGGGGGQGSADSSNNGGVSNAGTSSFFGANVLTVGGGNGVAAGGDRQGGAGGSASFTGTGITGIGIQGAAGGPASTSSTANTFIAGGQGGTSPVLSGGGGGGTAAGAGSNAIANSGGGGGGGGSPSAGHSGAGGGSGGFVDVLIKGAGIATSYPYVIGTKGTKGAAGTNGFAGGDGADGFMDVEEIYQ